MGPRPRALDFALPRGVHISVVVARGDLFTLSDWADDWTRGLALEWLDVAAKRLGSGDSLLPN